MYSSTVVPGVATANNDSAAIASASDVPFTRIIKPDVARNSVIVFAFALVVAIIGVLTLFPKAFPAAYAKLMTCVLKKPTPPARANASLLRARLLFVSALMMVGDAINNIAMIESADLTGNAAFVPFQLLRGITFVPAGPIFVMAMASRIAIIVVMRPKWKTWFLRAVYGIALYIMLQQQVILVIGVTQRLHLDPAGWIDALLFPTWTAGPMALLPIFSIGGSLVALRIAFNQPASSSSSSGSSSSTGTSSVPASQASPSTTSSKPTVQSGATTIKYPLTNAFTTLNVLILLEWIGFIACVANQNPPIPIRISAILGLILSMGILTEGSFEWLLKRGRKKQQQASAAASSTSSSHQQQQPSAFSKSSLSRVPSVIASKQQSGNAIAGPGNSTRTSVPHHLKDHNNASSGLMARASSQVSASDSAGMLQNAKM